VSAPTFRDVEDAMSDYRMCIIRGSHAGQTHDALVTAIAAHVAAEVAAERARCVVPQVVRDAVRYFARMYEEHGRGEREKSESTQLRAWLAALPPLTLEEA
jgi:hypothetical protein